MINIKILFVGDIHTHNYMINDIKILDNKYNFDKIILFGDYVDDWLSTGKDSLNTLSSVITLKQSNPDKYILLLGNHELSYLGYPCSGHNFEKELDINELLKNNLTLFNLNYTVELDNKNYVCTHARY